MNTNKEALQVSALCNGTVIDHIPADKLFAVVNLLDIPSMTTNVTIGYNLKSRKLGTKGLIKVADKFFTDDEVNRISLVAPNVVLNTAVAESFRLFADELENASDFENALHELIKRTIKEHKRIIFNGNGYDDAWIKEAEKRGLSNLKSTPDALSHLLDDKTVELYTKNKVFSEKELRARCEKKIQGPPREPWTDSRAQAYRLKESEQ